MKTIILSAIALMSVIPVVHADDSYNRGMKIQCLDQRTGPSVQRGEYLVIKKVEKQSRVKTVVLADKMAATMFSGKQMIGGWQALKTDIDAGKALYNNSGNEKVFMEIDKDGESTVSILTPDMKLTEAYNCNIEWLEN